MGTTEFRDAFYSWYAQFLKDRGLQFTKSGSKGSFNDKHAVDPATGYWVDPNYSGSKPIRWLINIDPFSDPPTAAVPSGHRSERIGHANTAQGDKAGIAVRLIPIIADGSGGFQAQEDWEITLLFCFAGPVPIGSAAETFDFDAASGSLSYLGKGQPYIFNALLGMVDRTDSISIGPKTLLFGEVIDAIRDIVASAPEGSTPSKVSIYDLAELPELARLESDVKAAYANSPAPVASDGAPTVIGAEEEAAETPAIGSLVVPENKDLLGIDPNVYSQINAALQAGKRHLMLYGPPGTGKTTLARHISQTLSPSKWTLVTGSADWSSQDIIGGYQPIGGGNVAFQPGALLRAFDQPFIIDEMNRCDIDKVLGPLFTVLSGHHTTLPYRTDIADPTSPSYVILAADKASAAAHEYAPTPAWRLIATINSIDKASLYQMSYALTRRFAWIYVDVPTDLRAFVSDYLRQIDTPLVAPAATDPCPLASLWESINSVRPIGPAPFIDIVLATRAAVPAAIFFGTPNEDVKAAILNAIDMALLPMLDGIPSQDAQTIAASIIATLALDENQQRRVQARMRGLAL
jgi:5-methylcytosine-specific restriction enzyme B